MSSMSGALSLALAAPASAILALTPELATLEDLFFRLTEGSGREPGGAGGRRRAHGRLRARSR